MPPRPSAPGLLALAPPAYDTSPGVSPVPRGAGLGSDAAGSTPAPEPPDAPAPAAASEPSERAGWSGPHAASATSASRAAVDRALDGSMVPPEERPPLAAHVADGV